MIEEWREKIKDWSNDKIKNKIKKYREITIPQATKIFMETKPMIERHGKPNKKYRNYKIKLKFQKKLLALERELARRQRIKERWNDEDWVKKWAKSINRKPNKPEQILISLFNNYSIPFIYVGDFKEMIGTKNPDFINDEKKLIIELSGDYWHSKEITKEENETHIKQRINYFKKYGYRTLIIWEKELDNCEEIINKVKEFIKPTNVNLITR